MFKTMLSLLKNLNRRRIRISRMRRISKSDIPYKLSVDRPSVTHKKKILLIDAMFGLGDALFANGLATKLAQNGNEVTVITLKRTLPIYQYNSQLKNLFNLESGDDVKECATLHYDCAVDLSYVGIDRWNLRINILKQIHTYCLTCSDLAKHANVFHQFIDLSKYEHVSERMAAIYNTLVPEELKCKRIFPRVSLLNDMMPSTTGKSIYVNTVAGEADRCLSNEQISTLIKWFNQQTEFVGYFYLPDEFSSIQETSTVKKTQPKSFAEAMKIVHDCVAVFSPDTSIVHVASGLNKPIFVIYCGQERDYFKQYWMKDVWSPLSSIQQQKSPKSNSDELTTNPLQKPIAISQYPCEVLLSDFEKFVKKIPTSSSSNKLF